MIKVTLGNGVVIEGDTANDVSEVVKALTTEADVSAEEAGNDYSDAILLSPKLFEVFDVISLFPQGVSARNVAALLSMKLTVVNSRIQSLKDKGAVAGVPGKELWVAAEEVVSGSARIICAVQMG